MVRDDERDQVKEQNRNIESAQRTRADELNRIAAAVQQERVHPNEVQREFLTDEQRQRRERYQIERTAAEICSIRFEPSVMREHPKEGETVLSQIKKSFDATELYPKKDDPFKSEHVTRAFAPEVFSELYVSEKVVALQEAERLSAKVEGRRQAHVASIKATEAAGQGWHKHEYAQYDLSTNTILMRDDFLESKNPREVLATLFHEQKHAEQQRFLAHGEGRENVLSERDAERLQMLQDGMRNYPRHTNDEESWQRYVNNSLEVEAQKHVLKLLEAYDRNNIRER